LKCLLVATQVAARVEVGGIVKRAMVAKGL
jgi:hypothetical protein